LKSGPEEMKGEEDMPTIAKMRFSSEDFYDIVPDGVERIKLELLDHV
jgi:hypothetical protein